MKPALAPCSHASGLPLITLPHVSNKNLVETSGATAPSREPNEAFVQELQLHAKLVKRAEHPALHVQNDATSAARAKLADVQEVMRTWCLAVYTRSQ